MLLVKTKIRPSKIDGIGLFAAEFIPRYTVVWRFIPGFDIRLDKKEVEKLPEAAKNQILKYAYLDENGEYVMCMDDARHFNHSGSPNTDSPDTLNSKEETIASCDIEPGEEMTCYYYQFDDDAYKKIGPR